MCGREGERTRASACDRARVERRRLSGRFCPEPLLQAREDETLLMCPFYLGRRTRPACASRQSVLVP